VPVAGAGPIYANCQQAAFQPSLPCEAGGRSLALFVGLSRRFLQAWRNRTDRNAADQTFTQMPLATHGDVPSHSWSAQFMEVRVYEDFGTVRVKCMVGAFDSGRVSNPNLARRQGVGGMAMGFGQALLEGFVDPRDGRIVKASFVDFVVAVNTDVPDITTIAVGEPYFQASSLGGKAVEELGIVSVAAALGNAVFHATDNAFVISRSRWASSAKTCGRGCIEATLA
jgi:xanthine dehydrogenase YagR molybdenum-binding subunit